MKSRFRNFIDVHGNNLELNFRIINALVIVNLYHELCDSIEIINSTFTLPLIFVFFYFFVVNMLTSFTHIWMFSHYLEYVAVLLSSDGVIMILNLILQGVTIHSSCSTTHEAEETAVIVSRIVNSLEYNKQQRKTLKALLVQIQYRNLKFKTPLFIINWKLLLAVS